jgi:hypothetical protein
MANQDTADKRLEKLKSIWPHLDNLARKKIQELDALLDPRLRAH